MSCFDHLMFEFGVFASDDVFLGYVKGFYRDEALRRWNAENPDSLPVVSVLSRSATSEKLKRKYLRAKNGEL